MFKLTIVAGPNRGSSYAIQDGENSIGRQSGNSVILSSGKVSKKHCVLVVSDGQILVKDQQSANGTFVNGVLTKREKKIVAGDRISVGEFVLEVSESRIGTEMAPLDNLLKFPVARKAPRSPVVAAPVMDSNEANDSAEKYGDMAPKSLPEKAGRIFEEKVMPFFYGLNFKNQWRFICVGVFAVFMLINILVAVHPLLESANVNLIQEIKARATFMAKMIAQKNAPYFKENAENRAEIGSLIENAEGVRLAMIVDLDRKVIAPASRYGSILGGGVESSFAGKMANAFRKGRETGLSDAIGSSTVIAVEPIKVALPNSAQNAIVAMAIVSVDTTLFTPDLGEIGMIYSQTLILTGLIGALFLFILYKLTLKPLRILSDDLEKALKGDIPQITHEFKFEELDSLWDLINSALQRLPKGEQAGLNGNPEPPSVEDLSTPLRMLGNVMKMGLVVLDHERKIVYLNSQFEEISGIRFDQAVGKEVSAAARDQAWSAFASDLLDRAPLGENHVADDYEFSGITYRVIASSFSIPASLHKYYVLGLSRSEA